MGNITERTIKCRIITDKVCDTDAKTILDRQPSRQSEIAELRNVLLM